MDITNDVANTLSIYKNGKEVHNIADNSSIDGFSRHVNLWYAVKSDIEIKILNGEYQPGQRLPSILQLSKLYGIGTTTAMKILEALNEDEILYKKQGVGYFVKLFNLDRIRNYHLSEVTSRLNNVALYAKRIGVSFEDFIIIASTAYRNTYDKG